MAYQAKITISTSFFLLLLIAFSPILFSINDAMHQTISSVLSGICNHKIERSFEIYSYHTLLCTRCVGVYFAAMLFFISPRELKKNLIIVLISLTIIDKTIEWIFDYTNLILRFINGFFLGIALSAILYKLSLKKKSIEV
jgi:uncharacterized membrane protein